MLLFPGGRRRSFWQPSRRGAASPVQRLRRALKSFLFFPIESRHFPAPVKCMRASRKRKPYDFSRWRRSPVVSTPSVQLWRVPGNRRLCRSFPCKNPNSSPKAVFFRPILLAPNRCLTDRLYRFSAVSQVLCLYCGVSMLNSCHPTAMNNQQVPAHLSCTSRQINFILTHLSAFVLHSVILLSYLLSPLSSVLLPSTILVSEACFQTQRINPATGPLRTGKPSEVAKQDFRPVSRP